MKRFEMLRIILISISFIFSPMTFSGMPTVSIIPVVRAPTLLPSNAIADASYQLTNNVATITTFYMQPMPGITQITGSGLCSNPIVLGLKESCQLGLEINGSQIAKKITSGPIIGNQLTSAMMRAQPSPEDSLNITVIGPASPLTLSPDVLPSGTFNHFYDQTITASGGVPPYRFSLTSGILPKGLSLSHAGVISGNPTSGGTFPITITARDALGVSGHIHYDLTITSHLITLAPTSLPNPVLNTSYSQTIIASGGTAPYTYRVSAGALPTGLAFNDSSGVISGTPTAEGTYNFTITATDATSLTGSNPYTLVVSGGVISLSPAKLPAATLNQAYSQTITASGGTSPYQFSVTSGALPAGLTLTSATGIIDGIPTTLGTYSFTVTAADTLSQTGSIHYSLQVLNTVNTWLSVLIAEDLPPTDPNQQDVYVAKIYALAPAAEQVHIRIPTFKHPYACTTPEPGLSLSSCYDPYQPFATVASKLSEVYGKDLLLGFHPDDSTADAPYWGCPTEDVPVTWQCVLNYSIIVMNNINAILLYRQSPTYSIYSIEQEGYIIPSDQEGIQLTKACLNPPDAAPGVSCPDGITIADPVVDYGNVLSSYGGPEIYGSDKLNYGYPQYYNLVKTVPKQYEYLLTDGYFPSNNTGCINSTSVYPITIIDGNTTVPHKSLAPANQLIPCNLAYPAYPANDVFTYPSGPPDPSQASAYLAYLMSQLTPLAGGVANPNGATVYITFSGEPWFLGAPGWTLDLINQFHSDLNSHLGVLNGDGIIAVPEALSSLKYGIWNFTEILAQE